MARRNTQFHAINHSQDFRIFEGRYIDNTRQINQGRPKASLFPCKKGSRSRPQMTIFKTNHQKTTDSHRICGERTKLIILVTHFRKDTNYQPSAQHPPSTSSPQATSAATAQHSSDGSPSAGSIRSPPPQEPQSSPIQATHPPPPSGPSPQAHTVP